MTEEQETVEQETLPEFEQRLHDVVARMDEQLNRAVGILAALTGETVPQEELYTIPAEGGVTAELTAHLGNLSKLLDVNDRTLSKLDYCVGDKNRPVILKGTASQ